MNKSEILAKLLGVEPKIGICDRELNSDDYAGECGFENPTEFECDDCTNFHTDLVIYPDFTHPDNFVKFLEIIYSNCGGIDEFAKENSFVDDFIEHILKALKEADSDNSSFVLLKKQAQQTDWRY